MVRIYGSGVPGGDVEDDSFSIREAVEHDAAVEAAMEAAREAGADDGETAVDDARVIADTEAFRAESLSRFDGYVFGDDFATVVAVKGQGDAGEGDNGFLESPLGEALRKTMESLGYDPWALAGIWTGDGRIDPPTLRSIVELVDPAAVIAVDSAAGRVLLEAFPTDAGGEARSSSEIPSPGQLAGQDLSATVCGRKHVYLHDFAGSLDDIDAKRRAWAALRTIKL